MCGGEMNKSTYRTFKEHIKELEARIKELEVENARITDVYKHEIVNEKFANSLLVQLLNSRKEDRPDINITP
jgi:hypothetical protein